MVKEPGKPPTNPYSSLASKATAVGRRPQKKKKKKKKHG